MNILALLPLANIFLATLLSGVVLLRNPRAIITKAFGLGALTVIIIELGHFLSMLLAPGTRMLLWHQVALAGACFLPFTWSLFSFIVLRPDPKAILKKRTAYLLFLVISSAGFLALLASGYVIYLPANAEWPQWGSLRFSGLGRWFLIYLLLSIVVILIVLENTYRNMRYRGGRYALFGLMGGLFYAIFLCGQGLLYARIPEPALVVGSAIVTLTCLLFAYDIVRYRLLQVEIYVGREAVYSSAILLLVGVFLVLMGLVAKLVSLIGGHLNLFLTIVVSFAMFFLLLVIIFSGSLRKRLKSFIDRNFYRGRYDYREQWLRFSEEMSSLLEPREILPRFLQMATETLEVNRACILLPDDVWGGDIVLAEVKGFPLAEFRIAKESDFLEWLFVLAEPIDVQDSRFDQNTSPEVRLQRDRFKQLGVSVIVPLITKRRLVGLLALGPGSSKEVYSNVDLELLDAIGNHLSVAILNAELSEQLVLSKELEFIHRISSYVVHDLKNLISSLSMMLQNAALNMEKPEFRENMLTTIEGTVVKMRDLMSKIRTVPKDSQLDLRPHDLNTILRGVVSKIRIDQMQYLHYEEDLQPLPNTSVDREHIERILMNLIVNALEAMQQQGTLRIATRIVEDGSAPGAGGVPPDSFPQFVEIEVADTGEGMDEEFIKHQLFRPFQTTKEKGLGIGMYQCREAVQAHGGRIEVQSSEGKGTVFRIHLPVIKSTRDHSV